MKNVLSAIEKRQRVRSIIFVRRSVSRQELIALSGCNARSVTRYTEELCKYRLIETDREAGQRGRPCIIYRSRSEKIIFAGITVTSGLVVVMATDINALPLAIRHCVFQEGISRGELLKMAFNCLDQLLSELSEYTLCGIGASETREWMRNNVRLGAEFILTAERRYHVPVELHDNDSLMLRHFAEQQMLSGKIGGIFFGSEFWIAVVDNGEIREDIDVYLRKLRHWRIAPDSSEECCCGKTGCLGAVLTYQGTISRFTRHSGIQPSRTSVNSNFNLLNTLAKNGDEEAFRIIKENGMLLGRAAARIRNDLKLDHMVLMHSTPVVRDFASATYRQETGAELLCFKGFYSDVVFSPAELMRSRLLNFDLNINNKEVI